MSVTKILLFIFILFSTPAWATNWWVRDGGGSVYGTSQATNTCNGNTNAVYSFGASPNCALSGPGLVIGVTGDRGTNQGKWVGGDTLNIEGDSDNSWNFVVSGVSTLPAVGDTYTSNAVTYTVVQTLATGLTSGTMILSGASAPLSSGTLTVVSGSGTSPISFSAESTAQARYMIGYGMPGYAGYVCNPAGYYTCVLVNVPAGTVSNPTTITGIGSQKPQLWGTGGLYQVLNANNNYITIRNIEITDHATCGYNNQVAQACNFVDNNALDAREGLVVSGINIVLSDVYVHGVGQTGINTGALTNPFFTRVWVIGNANAGMVIGSGGNQNMTGTLTWNQPIIDWNGCIEKYPMPYSGIENPNNVGNCYGHGNGGYGDGLPFGATGNNDPGNWVLIGPGSVSWNTQDGLDTRHGNANTRHVTIDKMRFEGNAGQQVKMQFLDDDVTNSIVIGDCGWWSGSPQASVGALNYATSDACRAGGNVFFLSVSVGGTYNFFNNTIISNAIAFETNDDANAGCDGTTSLNIKNNIINGGYEWNSDTTWNSSGGNGITTFYYNDGYQSGGSCFNLLAHEDYNIIYSAKDMAAHCLGTHDICSTLPGFTSGTFPTGTSGGPLSSFYQGQSGISLVPISNTSPAKSAGVGGLSYWNNALDYYNNSNSSIGGLEYQSTAANGYFCFFNSDCSSANCSNNYCGGACSANGVACANSSTCCNPFCISSQCSSCIANGSADGGSATNCCSGLQSGGNCVAYICGDGLVTGTEACDTSGPNLNNQTCYTQGFIGGSLSCNSGCLSFNTSSCNNTCLSTGTSCVANGQCCSTFCSGGTCTGNSGDITTGLVSWWKFDDGTGTSAADSAGSNTGTLHNTPTWVTGNIGTNALSFASSSSQYVDVGTNSTLHVALPLTISAWVKLNDLNNTYVVFGNAIDSSNANYSGADLQVSASTGQVSMQYGNGGAAGPGSRTSFKTTAGITAGTWHQLIGVATSPSSMAVYIDGVSSAGAITGTGSTLSYGSYSGRMASAGWGNTSYFNGIIDDVRLYNRALSSTDALTLYQYTSSCTANGQSCSTSGQCCSGSCSASVCVNPNVPSGNTGTLKGGTYRMSIY